MSRTLRDRLTKLEARAKALPELRCFWKEPGETWEQLRARAGAWQAERPEARWPTPMLIGLRDGEVMDPDKPRRVHP